MKVAIKKLTRPFQSAIHAKRTYREFRLLKQIKHENVIGLLDVFSPASSMSDMSDVYFVTHFMGADLNQIIKTQKVSLPCLTAFLPSDLTFDSIRLLARPAVG